MGHGLAQDLSFPKSVEITGLVGDAYARLWAGQRGTIFLE